ncbi:MAG: hypothetical protein ACXU8U_05890 [Asticcacaulis sp.]
MDNDRLMKQAEGYIALRRVLLIVNALGYIAWIGSEGLGHLGNLSVDPHTLSLVKLVAQPIWVLSLLGIFGVMARLRKRRDIAGLVDDERTRALSGWSFKAGYWVLLISIAGVYAANFFMTIDVRLVAPLLLALGVATPSLTYAVTYRN